MKNKKIKNLFSLNLKKLLLLAVAELVAIVLHNFLSGFFGTEEALFFIIAIFVIPIYFVVAAVFTLIKWMAKI